MHFTSRKAKVSISSTQYLKTFRFRHPSFNPARTRLVDRTGDLQKDGAGNQVHAVMQDEENQQKGETRFGKEKGGVRTEGEQNNSIITNPKTQAQKSKYIAK